MRIPIKAIKPIKLANFKSGFKSILSDLQLNCSPVRLNRTFFCKVASSYIVKNEVKRDFKNHMR